MKNIKSRKDEGLLFVVFFFLPWTAASNPCGKANLRGLKKEKKKIDEMAPIAVTGPGSAPRSVRAEIDWDVWYPGNSRYLQLVIKPF